MKWLLMLIVLLLPHFAAAQEQPTILVHYMPWYAAKPVSPGWGWHWTMNHFNPDQTENGKQQLASHFTPLIGPYDSSDIEVLQCQLIQMKVAGIDGVIVDWYGLTDLFDYSQLHHNTKMLIEQAEALKMQFAICYEDQTIKQLENKNRLQGDSLSHARKEIEWLQHNWMIKPGYVQFQNKPVLLSFGLDNLNDQQWSEVLQGKQEQICYVSQNTKRTAAMGAFDWPSPRLGAESIRTFRKELASWEMGIPVAYPRFIDIYEQAELHESYGRIEDQKGRTFRLSLQSALATKAKLIQIATWNDWGEGTIIEPSKEYGYRDLEYLQQQRQRRGELSGPWKAADLRLGEAFLKKCREGSLSKEQKTQLLNAIATQDVLTARSLLK